MHLASRRDCLQQAHGSDFAVDSYGDVRSEAALFHYAVANAGPEPLDVINQLAHRAAFYLNGRMASRERLEQRRDVDCGQA
jgi:hypothetical protein